MSSDAIVILKNDHKEIRKLFSDFEKLGDDAHKRKGQLVSKMIELLTVHTYLENEVMYPRVRELLPEVEDDVLESYEEHHVADVLVMELDAMKPDAERFTAKTTVLIENVRHHIEEEEEEWFPKVREGSPARCCRRSAPRWRPSGRRRRGGPPSPVRSRRRWTPSSSRIRIGSAWLRGRTAHAAGVPSRRARGRARGAASGRTRSRVAVRRRRAAATGRRTAATVR